MVGIRRPIVQFEGIQCQDVFANLFVIRTVVDSEHDMVSRYKSQDSVSSIPLSIISVLFCICLVVTKCRVVRMQAKP